MWHRPAKGGDISKVFEAGENLDGGVCQDLLLCSRAVGNDKGFEVKVIDKEQEVGDGKSKKAEGEKLEDNELCGLQWWG